MDKSKSLSAKQRKIAAAAEPKNKITGADFAALRGKPKPKRSMAKSMGYA